jgi:phage baseplate assembly protein gpV
MIAIDETTRTPKNVVIKAGTDRLLVDVGSVTLESGDITLDMSETNAILTDILSRFADRQDYWNYAGAGITNTTTPATIQAAAPGERHYMQAMQLTVTGGSGFRVVEVRSAAVALWRGAVNFAADREITIMFPVSLRGGVNEAMTVAMDSANAGTLYVSAQGWTSAE